MDEERLQVGHRSGIAVLLSHVWNLSYKLKLLESEVLNTPRPNKCTVPADWEEGESGQGQACVEGPHTGSAVKY